MSSPISETPNLGTLSILPFEIRHQIYALVLDLFADQYLPPQGDGPPSIPTLPPSSNRTALLQASKDVYKEAISILVNVNSFEIYIERELDPDTDEESQITFREGPWTYSLRAQARPLRKYSTPPLSLTTFTPEQRDAFVRRGLFKELRCVWLRIEDLQESDIVPCEEGPEIGVEPHQFTDLLSSILESLKGCVLKDLDLTIDELADVCWPPDDSEIPRHLQLARHTTGDPGIDTRGIQQVLDMISTLRGVGKCRVFAQGSDHRYNMGWIIAMHYAQYLRKVIQLPEGAEAPDWAPNTESVKPWEAFDPGYKFEFSGGDFEIGRPEDFEVR